MRSAKIVLNLMKCASFPLVIKASSISISVKANKNKNDVSQPGEVNASIRVEQ